MARFEEPASSLPGRDKSPHSSRIEIYNSTIFFVVPQNTRFVAFSFEEFPNYINKCCFGNEQLSDGIYAG
jgi:hypothetical protein